MSQIKENQQLLAADDGEASQQVSLGTQHCSLLLF